MIGIGPFAWRRLTADSVLEYALDERGALLLRGGERPPLATARVRDIDGVSRVRALDMLPFAWGRAGVRDGWILRSRGEPRTMERVDAVWGDPVRRASRSLGLDERIALVTIACEAGALTPDDEGLVKVPRTERGYPRRRSEADPGDFDRDAEDWAFHRTDPQRRPTHSQHGLMQTLVSTAVAARAELFEGIEPSRYRTVLWDPASSVACGLAYMASFEAGVRSDPLRMRFQYARGRIVNTRENPWGAGGIHDDLVALFFVALWNDDAWLRGCGRAPEARAVGGTRQERVAARFARSGGRLSV
jgi:hypothetical protein